MTQDKKKFYRKNISFYKVSLSKKKILEKFSVFFYKVHVIIFITNNVKIKNFLEKFSIVFIRLVQSKNLGKYNDEKKAQIILGFYVNR